MENLKGKVSPWHLLEMVRMTARLDSAGAATELMKKQKLPANFQGWAQLEIYLAELARAKDRVDSAAVEDVGAKGSLPRALAWEAWARHNTRVGYREEVLKAAREQEDPAIRSMLYLGAALGSQDRER